MINFLEYVVLQEAANSISNFTPGMRVKIKNNGGQIILEAGRGRHLGDLELDHIANGNTNLLHGYKLFNWHAEIPQGWGPFLYDIAMEIATLKQGYLVSHTFINRLQNQGANPETKGVTAGGDTSDAADKLYFKYFSGRRDIHIETPNIILGPEFLGQQANQPWLFHLYQKSPIILQQLIQMNQGKDSLNALLVNAMDQPKLYLLRNERLMQK